MTDPTEAKDTPKTPYIGLVPYDEADAALFFGRDEEKRIVAGNLRASRLTILYGPSGVGKTSLIRAGVVHDVREQVLASAVDRNGEQVPYAICVFREWRDDPVPVLMAAIEPALTEALGGQAVEAWQPGEPLVDALARWTKQVRTVLVVLDQFEDFFLYHGDEDGEGTFAREFPAIVNEPNLRVNFLLSIREDAWAKLDLFEGRIPRVFANYVRVEHLSRPAAREAIERPIDEWNRRLPPGEQPFTLDGALVDAVLDAAVAGGLPLTRIGDVPEPSSPTVEQIEAPFLQLVMERVWRATVEAGARDLTNARLEQLGGARRVVENHLLEALGALTPGEQAVASDLFRFLVTSSKTKIAHSASDLAEWTGRPEPEVTAVLEKLSHGESGRILRPVSPATDSDPVRYELFHDVLAEPSLEWRRGFEQERARRAAIRRFARVGGVLLALVAVFAGLGIWALLQRNDAVHATQSATSLALSAAARGQLPAHVDRALLLSLEAYRSSPSADAASTMVDALETARRSGAAAILRGDPGGIRAVASSSDGRTLASSDFTGAIQLWDVRDRVPLGEPIAAHEQQIWGLAISPDGRTLASASHDGTVKLWDVRTHALVGEVPVGNRGVMTSVAFSPDGKTLATGGAGGYLRLWNTRSRRPLGRPLPGHGDQVVGVAFSPDGHLLASASFDGTVGLWDVPSGRPLGRFTNGHDGQVLSVAFSPDGNTLASSGSDGTVRLLNVRTRRTLGPVPSRNAGQAWSVAFTPDGNTLAWSGSDGTVQLWDLRTHKPLEPLRGHVGKVVSIAVDPNGRALASAGYDGTVRLWDLRGIRFGAPIGSHSDRVTGVAFSPDGRTLVTSSFDRTVRLWRASEGKPGTVLLQNPTDGFEGVAVSPDGGTVAAASDDGDVWLARLPAGGQSDAPLHVSDEALRTVAISSDSHTLAAAGEDGSVHLFDLANRKQPGVVLTGHTDPIDSVAFSQDGRTLASASSDGTVRLWNVASGRPVGQLPLEEGDEVVSLAFRDDDVLATGSFDGTVRLWDARARKALGEPLPGAAKSEAAESVAFSPDGRTLAAANADGTLRLWDVDGRRALGVPLEGRSGPLFGVAFSPDGHAIVSGGDDGTVRLWDGILWRDFSDLETQVCRLVVGNLTESEWGQLAPGLAYRTTCQN